ncbi:hypothetical protein PAL_GLEAN10010857 [Pteropus alecto]|uniref:Uncharacterized protein n=1 Tax=Pteropus alecto TaxID=9402 RepID=L5KXQ4_PTEAL|nr:hypothetical protein PAL_GLEAN10010857 [Pteropus alecto]
MREAEGPRLGEIKGPIHSPLLSPTAGCWELVNPWCSLVTLTAHLRQMGQVPRDEELRWLSGLPRTSNSRRRRPGTRRGHQEQGPSSRPQRLGSLLSRTR